jgi:hypothetical protein
MSVTASLNGTLQLTDNLAGNTTFLKQLLLSYTGTVSSFAQSQLISTGSTTISLPAGSAQFVYIRNVSTIVGNTVTVGWTPRNESPATVTILDPGAAILLSETSTSNGITSLSVAASAANTPIEYILAS